MSAVTESLGDGRRPRLRISAIRTLVYGTPWRNLAFVLVATDEGVEGVGEVRMLNNTAAFCAYVEEIAPRVLGRDPFETEALVQDVQHRPYARAGDITMAAAATLEIACWDIVGKVLGEPVHRLLGGRVRDVMPAYANGWYTGERTPEAFHAAARHVVERGYRALKVDPFEGPRFALDRPTLHHAVALVEAVRDAIGPDADLMIELHGRFTPAQAIEVANELAPFRPAWLEEPVPPDNVRALEKVARSVTAPIATGERVHTRHEFRELLELQVADVLQPDHTMCGGILETRKLAAWAEAYFVPIAPHNVGGPVSTAAALHLGACTPNFLVQEHFNDFADSEVKLACPGAPEVVDGVFAVPEAPGLGVTIDEDAIAEHPATDIFFDLFKTGWNRRKGMDLRR